MLRAAIVGYGNLGKGVEKALLDREDAKIVGIFTRRNPETLHTLGTKAYSIDDLIGKRGEIDVCILCGGSARDLPEQTPELSKYFNTVDSYDNHGLIKAYKEKIGKNTNKTTSVISIGWDPGLFSLQRLYIESVLGVKGHTFWGTGVSQGHSDAIRRIDGVEDAIQLTVPKKEAIDKARQGTRDILDKHKRVCYVVTDREDKEILAKEIKTMPHYFADYETEVYFVTQKELNDRFPTMPHGGFVIGSDKGSSMEFSLKLKSNPNFTAKVLVAYAYACTHLNRDEKYGVYTIFDIAPKYVMKDYFGIL